VVFTEDSDLLAFGCTHVFFKMDNLGNGQYINLEQLNEIKEFDNFQGDMLLVTSILSGCDYLDSIKGIGFKKATKLVHDHPVDSFEECMKILRADKKITIPPEYEQLYLQAFLTFKF
jgi:exonuclease-1